MSIPVAGMLFTLSTVRDAQFSLELAAVLVLGISCTVGLYLELAGGGVYSNLYVNVTIIVSGIAIRATTFRREKRSSPNNPTKSEATDTDTDFWDDPKSALPDTESVLIVALIAVGQSCFSTLPGSIR